ncbi:hypothetical protein C2S51_001936 [Perilla frutescens var. frutescens]|nr:hypothetical protein C2S51_001936 [Perilla frutescens var. frutescens]
MVVKKAWSSTLYGRISYNKRVKSLRRKLSTVNPVSKCDRSHHVFKLAMWDYAVSQKADCKTDSPQIDLAWDFRSRANTELSPYPFWKIGLCLRKLFLTGLNLMINIPMKAEDLVQSLITYKHIYPQIQCVLVKNLEIPCSSEEIKQMTTRRRVYVLTAVRLCVDATMLDFVDDTADDFSPYQGCRAQSLVVIPFVKSKP